jgi:phosphatidylglycerophosphatase A
MPSKKLLEFIVTFGFIGKIKYARETLISLAAFLIMWFLPLFLGNPSPIESLFSAPWFFVLLFFTFFDAKKPWPVKWLNNNIKGGLRIMLDGLLAAVFASIAFCGIFFGVLNFV